MFRRKTTTSSLISLDHLLPTTCGFRSRATIFSFLVTVRPTTKVKSTSYSS